MDADDSSSELDGCLFASVGIFFGCTFSSQNNFSDRPFSSYCRAIFVVVLSLSRVFFWLSFIFAWYFGRCPFSSQDNALVVLSLPRVFFGLTFRFPG